MLQNRQEELWKFRPGLGSCSTTSNVAGRRRAVRRGEGVSGWGGAVPLWGGRVAQEEVNFLEQGRFGMGIQEAA
jgi:hypothetical protein